MLGMIAGRVNLTATLGIIIDDAGPQTKISPRRSRKANSKGVLWRIYGPITFISSSMKHGHFATGRLGQNTNERVPEILALESGMRGNGRCDTDQESLNCKPSTFFWELEPLKKY
jgi:hypothetical protein